MVIELAIVAVVAVVVLVIASVVLVALNRRGRSTMSLPAGLPTTVFVHGPDCRLVKADPDMVVPWNQSAHDAELYERKCGCSFEYFRLPREEHRPPQPQASAHRHGGNQLCPEGTVEFSWDSGSWVSFCGRCQSWTHYLPSDFDTREYANFGPAPVPYTPPDYAALERSRRERAEAAERTRLRELLGLKNDDEVVA